MAVAICEPKNGSSPEPSATLPHLGSRATSTMGEKVQFNPSAEASLAAIIAERRISAVSQLQLIASGIGKVVLYPCITSEPKNNGIFNRDSFITMSCALRIFSCPITPNMPPTLPSRNFFSTSVLTTDPVRIPEPGVIKFS